MGVTSNWCHPQGHHARRPPTTVPDIQEELEEEENEFHEIEEEEEETVEMIEYFASVEEYAEEVVPSPTPSPLPEGECWIPDPKDDSPMPEYISVFPGDDNYPDWGRNEGQCYMHIDLCSYSGDPL